LVWIILVDFKKMFVVDVGSNITRVPVTFELPLSRWYALEHLAIIVSIPYPAMNSISQIVGFVMVYIPHENYLQVCGRW